MLYPYVGPAGSGKSTYMIEQIKALAGHGERVLLLVPEQFSFEMERRILLELGAKAVPFVEVKSFSHLCRKIYMEFGGGAGQRISEAAKYMLMRLSLDEIKDQLDQYGRVASRSGFVPSILQLIEQFKNAGVTAEKLQAFAALSGEERLKQKTEELYEIYRVYQAYLEQGFCDEREDLSRCTELIRGKNYFQSVHIFLDAFRDFTPVERNFLSVALESCKGMHLTILSKNLNIKGNRSNDDGNDVFRIVKENALHIISAAKEQNVAVAAPICFTESHRFTSPELKWLADALTQKTIQPFDGPCECLSFYEASDPYEELRYVAAQIVHLVKYEGFRYKDFTIIARDLEKYQVEMEQLFRRHDIPLFWDSRMDIKHVALIRAVLEALQAVQTKLESQHVLALAKSPVLGLEHTAVLELENYCYTWRINKEQWRSPWENNPRGISGTFSDEEKESLQRINETAAAVMQPLLHLEAALQQADGFQFATAVYQFLLEVQAQEHLTAAFADDNLLYQQVLEQNNEAWDLLMDLLDTMAVVLKDHPMSLEQLYELFRMGLEASDFGTIPNTLDQVAVGTADRIRPNEPKVVFVIGMNQGEFPPKLGEQPFFTDGERGVLLEAGIQIGPTIVRQSDYENLYLYSALTAASQRLFLCCHGALNDGSVCTPSSEYLSLLKQSGATQKKKADLGAMFFAVNEQSAFDVLCSQYRFDNEAVSALYSYVKNGCKAEQLEKVEEVLNRKDFEIENAALAQELFGRTMHLSPSNVNKYFSCPFSYFCYSGLRLRSRNRADYSSLEAGNLLHHLLSEMITRHGGKGLADYSLSELETESRQIVEEYLENFVGDKDKLKQRSQYLFRNLAHRASFILKQLGDEFSQSEFEPLYCELPIRPGSPVPPVVFETQDGVRLSIEGVVDRVDVMEKNGRRFARVVDYKSGGQSFSFTEMYYGLKLQMLLYLLSICENGSGSLKHALPGGVLYFPAKDAAMAVERNEKDVESQRRKKYKMTGLVLEDKDCIYGMEQPQIKVTKGKEQKMVMGQYIPVKSTANGWHATHSKLVNEQQMNLIFRHIRQLMTDMAGNLSHGRIEALPVGTKTDQPCTYCEFRSICQHQDKDAKTILTSLKKEDCFENLKQQYAEEEQAEQRRE